MSNTKQVLRLKADIIKKLLSDPLMHYYHCSICIYLKINTVKSAVR